MLIFVGLFATTFVSAEPNQQENGLPLDITGIGKGPFGQGTRALTVEQGTPTLDLYELDLHPTKPSKQPFDTTIIANTPVGHGTGGLWLDADNPHLSNCHSSRAKLLSDSRISTLGRASSHLRSLSSEKAPQAKVKGSSLLTPKASSVVPRLEAAGTLCQQALSPERHADLLMCCMTGLDRVIGLSLSLLPLFASATHFVMTHPLFS